jgi:S1-C subfamily serine protease
VRAAALIAAAALALTAAGCGGGSGKSVTVVETVVRTAPAAPPATTGARGASTADIVARVLPGVVNVTTRTFDGDKSEGSGVVIDRSGVIVTNNHVVQGARTVTVSFNDGRHTKPVRAQVIGTAAERDLAILRVKLTDLVPVPLGHSSQLRLGDGVLAIGFPLGLTGGPTVTQGIVSGLHRTVHADGGPSLEGLLQTDAAINPGNSGGPLVDAAGRLIGINTVAASSAENVGFAISIDEARPVINEIRSKPADQRAWVGATFDSIDSAAAAVQIGLAPGVRGAAAIAVFADSPASKAGLKEGDVIVSIDGRRVTSTEGVSKVLGSHKPGDSVVLDVVDPAGPRRATVTLGKRPATAPGG